MRDHWVSCRPFKKIGTNHLLCGRRSDGVNVCSMAHEFASNFWRFEGSDATCYEKRDFLSR
jgi:hypothetical protein